MKVLKYVGIILAIGCVFYAKIQIDKKNKAQITTIETLDEDDGATPVAKKK